MAKTPRNVRLRWARKILQAKHFVVLTDKDSVIAIEGVSPTSLDDIIELAEQAAAIESFIFRLRELQKEHDARMSDLLKGNHVKAKKTKRPVHKIKVKEQ